jgi:transcriptional regulator with XRE-family HTH domain
VTPYSKDDLQRSIGGKVRQHRKALGLNLNDLSRLSGIAVPALSLIETGRRDVKLSTLVRLANSLRISIGDLMLTDRDATPIPADGYKQTPGYDLDGD